MHLHVLILLFSLLWLLLLFSLLQKVFMSFPQGIFFFFYIKLVLKDVEIEGVKLALPNLHLCKQEPPWCVWGSDFPPCPSLTTHSTCGVSSWSEPVDWGAPSQRLSKSWFFWLQGFGSKAQEAPCARSKTPQWTLLPSVHQFTCRSGVLHEWEESVWFYFGTWIKHQKVSKVESTWIPSSSQCRSTPILLFYIYIQKKSLWYVNHGELFLASEPWF